MRLILAVLTGLIATTGFAADDIRREVIRFAKGASSATISGKLKGYATNDYLLRASAGQTLVADFAASNRAAYFNILPPGTEEALFVGTLGGEHFEGRLPADGDYTLRVYLMRSAARRKESTTYQLKVAVNSGSAAAPAFDKTLDLQGIRFHVSSSAKGGQTTLRIEPAGLKIDNSPVERTLDGEVTGAEVADLNADGSPEIYVYQYVKTRDTGEFADLVAYAANNRKSLSEVSLPSLRDDPKAVAGYLGRDEFAVVETALVRRFPIYREGDAPDKPSGGMRQIQYKLAPGEATWALKVDKIVDF